MNASDIQSVTLSTVTPVYKGADYILELIRALDDVRSTINSSRIPLQLVESIFVVDDAPDESEMILADAAMDHPWVRIVSLSRNFGQHPATLAGIMYSSTDWVVTLDEDLQHHPRYILDMLRLAISSEADLVYGVPCTTVHTSWYRNLGSKIVKRVVSWVSGNVHIRYFNSFRLVRGDLARAAASLASHAAYLDLALCWFTSRVHTKQLPLSDPRSAEQSGYSIGALARHAQRLLMASNFRGLAVLGLLAVLSILLAVVGLIGVLVLRFAIPESVTLQGWASLMVVNLLYGGFTVFAASASLAFVMSLYHHMLGKPVFYVVDRSRDKFLLDAWSCDASD